MRRFLPTSLLPLLLLSSALLPCFAIGFDASSICAAEHAAIKTAHRIQDRKRADVGIQHDQQDPSFAMSWVSRTRGGGARVPAGGKAEHSSGVGGGSAGGKSGQDDVEVALVGNFPNRHE